MNKLGILIQGSSSNVEEQKSKWGDKLNDLLFSTWVGEEIKYKNTDKVIFNDYPADFGSANFNLQIITTINGLTEMKKLGYTHVLKLRSDLVPTNYQDFLKLIDNDNLNFLCWHEHIVYDNCPGYLVDYLMSGPIDDMINLWSINDNFCVVPEIILTWSYISKLSNLPINYFLDSLNTNNDLLWIKNNIHLSSYQSNNIYDKYKKYDFSLNKENLKSDYLKFLNKKYE